MSQQEQPGDFIQLAQELSTAACEVMMQAAEGARLEK